MTTITITIGNENWSKINFINERAAFMTTQDNLKATISKAYFLLNASEEDKEEPEEDWFEKFEPVPEPADDDEGYY